ncbi:hypothetical protein PHLCEN_2v10032 [Hermanssonia centrifuga]|uniref:Uncharacterized protein n=1 Tax=Hermanssonia centrifuga TaxID=98765 RepID=A0A2R6NP21_9APHY|nr:hypothetical protein PHLCEN_2v10032 [Hermanssonia centrifuga]
MSITNDEEQAQLESITAFFLTAPTPFLDNTATSLWILHIAHMISEYGLLDPNLQSKTIQNILRLLHAMVLPYANNSRFTAATRHIPAPAKSIHAYFPIHDGSGDEDTSDSSQNTDSVSDNTGHVDTPAQTTASCSTSTPSTASLSAPGTHGKSQDRTPAQHHRVKRALCINSESTHGTRCDPNDSSLDNDDPAPPPQKRPMLTHAPGRHISAPLTVTNVETTKECTSCIPLVNYQTPLLPPLLLHIPSTTGQVGCSNRPQGTLPTSAQRPSHADLHQLALAEQIIRDLHVKRELMGDLGLYIQCLESMKRTLDEYQCDLILS